MEQVLQGKTKLVLPHSAYTLLGHGERKRTRKEVKYVSTLSERRFGS